MAVTSTLLSRTITLSMANGVSESGVAKIKNRTYKNINPEATAANMHSTATTLGSLMDSDLLKIVYSEKNLLESEEANAD